MEYLCLFLFVLMLVTVVGHGIWMVCAWIVGGLFGNAGASRKDSAAEECLRCGRLRPSWRRDCEACSLDSQGELAHELADLRATSRQLRRLLDKAGLDRAAYETLLEAVTQREFRLLGRPVTKPSVRPLPRLAAAPVAEEEELLTVLPADAPPTSPGPAIPVVHLLANLLTSGRVSDLPGTERERALGWYRACSEADLGGLSLRIQRELARLLGLSSRDGEALAAFRRALAAHPGDESAAEVALEAGRFAIQVKNPIEALAFLKQAAEWAVSAGTRSEAEKLIARLAPRPEVGREAAIVAAPEPAAWAEPVAPAAPTFAQPAPSVANAMPAAGEPIPVLALAAVEPEPPRPPRRSLLELLSAFMEQGNILWGELVGGLLIVVFSIALVISLWPKLEENPAYQFMIFVSVTAMLFGAGLYTLHHWKLEATSRGLLIIGTLLVPLNFLAIASQTRGISGPLELALEFGSLAVFGALLFFTGRVLTPAAPAWFTLAVLGASTSQLLVTKTLSEATASAASTVFLLGCVPVLCHLVGCSGGLVRSRRGSGAERATELFVFLGTSTFAVGTALGLLISWSVFQQAGLTLTVARVALLVAAAALPLLAGGVLIPRLLDESSSTGVFRTAATATALAGMFVMLLAVALAWPISTAVLAVCLLNFIVLSYVAFRQQMPFAHAAALACLTLGYLAAFHLGIGSDVAAGLFIDINGMALVPLALLLVGVAEGLFRFVRGPHGDFYGAAAAVVAVGSMLFITVPDRGIDAPARAMLVYGLYGIVALIANARWRLPLVTSIGLTLLVAASLWGLWWNDLDEVSQRVPLWSAVLAGEGLLLAGLFALTGRRTAEGGLWQNVYREPAARTAEGLTLLALLAALWSRLTVGAWSGHHLFTGGSLFALFLVLGLVERRRALVRFSGAVLIGTAIAASGWVADLQGAILPDKLALAAFGLATSAAVLAMGVTLARLLKPASADEQSPLLAAWRGPAAVAALLSLAVAIGTASMATSPLIPWAGVLLTVAVFLLAWEYDYPALAWIASGLALATLTYDLGRRFEFLAPWPQIALLTHATLAMVGALAAKRQPGAADRWQRLFIQPLDQSALLTSTCALSLLVQLQWQTLQPASLCLLWLAGLWLVVAALEIRPGLFAAAQAVLVLGVVGMTAANLTGREWFVAHPWGSIDRVFDPRSLQAFGLALAGLTLTWMAARFGLRGKPAAQRLLESEWPGLDRVLLVVLVVGQLVVAAVFLTPSLVWEFAPRAHVGFRAGLEAYAFGGGAWLLLSALAIALVSGLWDRIGSACVLGLVLLGLTVPVLIAGRFIAEDAAPLALRWGLGIGFVAGSIPVWRRQRLAVLARHWHWNINAEPVLPMLVRGLLVLGTAVPILALTTGLAMLPIVGLRPQRPLEGSFFASLSTTVANVVPLALVAFVLVGNALRERSSGYAFASGLVVNLAILLGHAIGFVTQHGRLEGALAVQLAIQLLQLTSVAAGLWAMAWIAVRGRWFDDRPVPWLLNVKIMLGAAATILVMSVALADLVSSVPPLVPAWTAEAGSFLGWLALGSVTAAGLYHAREQKRAIQPFTLGLIGMALVAQMACSVAAGMPAWGYRSLMLGSAGFALVCVMVGWRRTQVREWLEAISNWVGIAGGTAALLAVKAAIVHADQRWAALTIGLPAVASAIVAVCRREESWAFAAGLGVNLAASLLVWAGHQDQVIADWWVPLLQANAIAAAVGTMIWLAVRERLYGAGEARVQPGLLLHLQMNLGLSVNLLLLAAGLIPLLIAPDRSLPEVLAGVGSAWGWLAFALALSAWYAGRVFVLDRPWTTMPAAALLGAGVLAACGLSDTGSWAAYHTLMGLWAAAGFAALRDTAWIKRRFGETVTQNPTLVLAIGGLALALAIRATWEDPSRPYWPAGAVLAICLLVSRLAFETRVPAHVLIAGFLVNLVGFVAWVAWGSGMESFFQTQALCFGFASALWSLAALALHRPDERPFVLSWPALVQPFTHLAALLGLCALAGLTIAQVFWTLSGLGIVSAGLLAWAALIAVSAPFVLRLREERAPLAREGLYLLGLTAIGLILNAAGPGFNDYLWSATLALAPYVALTAALAWAFLRNPQLGPRLGIQPAAKGMSWFIAAQSGVAIVAAALSVWMSLDATHAFAGRLAGPFAAAALVLGFVLLTELHTIETALLRHAALVLGVLTAAEVGWAWIDGTQHTLSWLMLHRSVLLMVSLAVMTVLYGMVLARRLPGAWADCCRRMAPVLGATASAVLVVVLMQEAWLYTGAGGAPMDTAAVCVVALALAGLIASGLTFAVAPGRDPLGLSERGRTVYVYAAEVLLVLVFVHLRLTEPLLFRQGIAARYWPFLLMAVAFLGALLSEFFQRRGLRVLAEPLERTGVFLPLLPMLAAWAVPTTNYAFVWFSAGLLYGLLSVRKGSFRFALAAALAVNLGLWVLLFQAVQAGFDVDFFRHPQLWLIPLALIMLVSEYYNRDRLNPQQSAMLRYLGMIVIYVSSTADMFIAGVGNSALYPLILAVLSVLGILSGMVFRIRAFLLLGVSFLLLVLFSIIWHAGVDRGQTWILWSAGIALGVAILVLFGIFEKRRNDVLGVIENLKRWR